MLISIEGVDGVGKTTQADLLEKRLCQNGHDAILCREPGATTVGEKIRQLLSKYGRRDLIFERTKFFLIMASRSELMAVIQDSLHNGKVVVTDRFIDSTTAYQSVASDIPLRTIQKWNDFVAGKPDITFLITMGRSVFSKTSLSAVERNFLRRVDETYRVIAEEEPERFVVIDGEQSIDDIHEQIWGELLAHFTPFRVERNTDGTL